MRTRRAFLKQAGVGGAAWLGARALARAAGAAAAVRPNILIVLADDWSYPHAGAYGCQWVRTPAFDRMANEGLLFTNAYTPDAKCAPSRACILTGRNPWQLGAAANHWCYFPAKFRTVMEALAAHGYTVGHAGKGWAPGVSGELNGQPRLLTGPRLPFPKFMEQREPGKPFCFWYGSTRPHRPYVAGSGAKAGKRTAQIERVPACWPDNPIVRNDMLDYALAAEQFDAELDALLKTLDASGEAERTLVIVASDNGMPFPRGKGNCYELSVHMPLAIRWPAGIRTPGRRPQVYTSFVDLVPTLLDVADVSPEASGMSALAGISLCDVFDDVPPMQAPRPRDHVLIGRERNDVGRPHDEGYPIRGIVKDHYLYLLNFEPERWPAVNPESGYLDTDGSPTKTWCVQARRLPPYRRYWELCFGKRPREELYHLAADPDCVRNLAQDPAHAAVRERLKTQLLDELKQQGDPRLHGQGQTFDAFPNASPQRGFYERVQSGEKVEAGWVLPTDFDRAGE